ncbi:MAG: thiamine pyrophosphate-binding protein [Caldilineaceae bacterium]
MPILNGGQALIESLQRAGIRTVFGVPGAGQYEAVDALYGRSDIRYISLRHEQAASYMADGYARASGEIAAALVLPGPGVYNAGAGIATAYATSTPMLVITGTRHQEGAPPAENELDWYNNLAKWAVRAKSPAKIPSLVQTAIGQLTSGRPRPVVIEISSQVFAMQEEVTLPEHWSRGSLIEKSLGIVLSPFQTPGVPQRSVELTQATQHLAQAQRPVIWAGGGVHSARAWHTLQALAELLQAPVVTTPEGKGALSDRHPLSLGLAELRYAPLKRWLDQRNLVLAVGTRSDVTKQLPNAHIIRIDIDPDQIKQNERQLALVGDADEILTALHTLLQDATSTRPSIADEVRSLNQQRFDPAKQLQPQWELMTAIRAALPDDGILVQGMNQMGYYSRNYFPVYHPRSYITASPLATLGAAFPQALGAKVAQPERAVVALCGDGGFLYNAQELATAVKYGINVVVIVFNDNAYGNVLRTQEEQFDGRVIGTELHNPDFVKLAEAYGVVGMRASDGNSLYTALSTAIANHAPTLIEVPVGKMRREY